MALAGCLERDTLRRDEDKEAQSQTLMILQNCKPLQRHWRNIQTSSELLIQRVWDSDRRSWVISEPIVSQRKVTTALMSVWPSANGKRFRFLMQWVALYMLKNKHKQGFYLCTICTSIPLQPLEKQVKPNTAVKRIYFQSRIHLDWKQTLCSPQVCMSFLLVFWFPPTS